MKPLKKQALFRYQKQPVQPAFAEERRDPQAHPFPTKSGKIEIFSEKVYRTEFKEFVPAIPRYVPPVEGPQDPLTEKYPLQPTGWHTKRRCHSIHDNNQAMHKIDPQMLWMNPVDAAAGTCRTETWQRCSMTAAGSACRCASPTGSCRG